VLESSGRSLLVLVPLLIGAWTESVSTAGQVAACPAAFDRTFGVAVSLCPTEAPGSSIPLRGCDVSAAVTDLLKPPAEVAGMISSSFHPRSLPVAPRSILMVALGFLCVSLVHDRRIWLAMAACLLPLGHSRPNVIPSLSSHHRGGRHFEHRTPPCIPPLYKERVPLCVCVPPVRKANASDREVPDAPYAIVPSRSASNRLLPCRIANADPVWSVFCQVIFAQLARGPPSPAWRTRFQPSVQRVDARKALAYEG
jgi:hypothetical protein